LFDRPGLLCRDILVRFANFSRFLADLSTNFFHFFRRGSKKRREVAEAHLYDQVIGRLVDMPAFSTAQRTHV
jgi:hypothetical protein